MYKWVIYFWMMMLFESGAESVFYARALLRFISDDGSSNRGVCTMYH